MSTVDRRSLLKVFGVGSAAIATSIEGKPTSVEVVTDPDAKALNTRPEVSGYPLAWLDVQKGKLYSALEVGGGAPNENRYQLFREPVGSYCGWKSGRLGFHDTNLYHPSCLEMPSQFCVERIGVVFSPTSDPKTMAEWIEQHTLEFHIGCKVYWRSPMAEMFNVFSEVGVAHDGYESFNNAEPLKSFVDLGDVPFIIQAGQQFHVEIVGQHYPIKPLRLWAVLEGLHARGIQ